MHSQLLLSEIEKIVEAACAADTNIFSYTIWTHHITRVAARARSLAAHFGADSEIVVIAALLHDYASVKSAELYPDHHIHGPVEAEKLLRQFDYPEDRIEKVKHAIEAHRGSVSIARRSPEAECLANADALAHIESVPSLLHLAYVNQHRSVDDGAAWVLAKLERSWAKLHSSIQMVAAEQYQAARQILTFHLEHNNDETA